MCTHTHTRAVAHCCIEKKMKIERTHTHTCMNVCSTSHSHSTVYQPSHLALPSTSACLTALVATLPR